MSENNTLSKGQIALQQARRRGFNVKELPEALKKEITPMTKLLSMQLMQLKSME